MACPGSWRTASADRDRAVFVRVYRPWMDAIAGAFLSNEGVTGVRVQVAYDVVTQGRSRDRRL